MIGEVVATKLNVSSFKQLIYGLACLRETCVLNMVVDIYVCLVQSYSLIYVT